MLSPRYPYPLISGDRVRIHYMARELSRHFDATLLCLCDDEDEFRAPVPSHSPFDSIERIWLPRWRSYANVLRALGSAAPLQVAYYRHAEFARRTRELVAGHDIVLAHLVRTAGYALDISLPKVLEMTDAISLTYERTKGTTSKRRVRTWIYGIEQRRLRRYEERMLEAFDPVSLVSHVDRSYLLKTVERENVLVCPNGVDLDEYPFQLQFDAAPVVVFFGNMTTLPNLDACTYFVREVLPSLRKIRPWTFRVIGRIRAPDARALRALDGVEVVGEVPSIAAAVRGARAGVCPMRIGAGMQNKLLEYMALGLPAITSTLSLRPISARPDAEVLVADDPEAFVRQVERLYADTELSRRLAAAARTYVADNHAWGAHLAPLVLAMLHAVGQAPRRIQR